MKKILKKNQIIITALALMIAVAGYINYRDSLNRENEQTANNATNIGETDAYSAVLSNDSEPDDYSVTNPGSAVFTGSTTIGNSDFIINAKLEREQVRAANKETLLEIINNTNIQDESKQEAISAMIKMTDVSEREEAAELLLEAKGFADVIVSITDSQADVIVNTDALSDAQRAQIEDINKRKSGISVENITISAIAASSVTDDITNDNTNDITGTTE